MKEKKRAENEVIHLRPHHGLCLQNFRGSGYSDAFCSNMAEMKDYLRMHPAVSVEITKGADDLCAKCPHRRGKECESPHPPIFDENVLRKTGLEYGMTLRWEEFERRTCALSCRYLDETCPGCEWLELCHRVAEERKLNLQTARKCV